MNFSPPPLELSGLIFGGDLFRDFFRASKKVIFLSVQATKKELFCGFPKPLSGSAPISGPDGFLLANIRPEYVLNKANVYINTNT